MAANSSDIKDMGFTHERVEHALSVTGYTGVGPATEWLLSHVEDTTGRVLGTANDTESGATPVPRQAQSLKCDDCGKLLRSELEVQTHAARTQHKNFSESTEEIKPLSKEQKKAQPEKYNGH